MSVDKTLKDINRFELDFDRYEVFNALPSHFDAKYPNLIKFLEKYYKSLEEDENPVSNVQDLLLSRDVTQTKTEFLTFIASELLLGEPYFESFTDKRSAVQNSSILYRSKGTEYSIKQFFRIFYGVDIEVEYGKDRLFLIGDPKEETIEYTGSSESGNIFGITFEDSTVIVYLETSSGVFVEIREGEDYDLNYVQKSIILKKTTTPSWTTDELGNPTSYANDPSLLYVANNGLLSVGKKIRIVSEKRSQTAIGADVTDKRLTDNRFFQLYGLLISTPISVSVWQRAYKTFIHPAGMYLAGQVDINSVFDFGFGPVPPAIIQPPLPILIEQSADLAPKSLFTTSITEIGPGPNGYNIRTRTNDMFHPRTIDKWHTQYGSLADADDINARTMDDSYADLSNDFNLLDEDIWHFDYLHPVDSDGAGNRTPILGYNGTNIVDNA
jgi:hypothetical protein